MKKLLKCLTAVGVACTLCVPCLASCGGEGETLSGTWELSTATLDGKSVKKNFQAFTATFDESGNATVNISYLGLYETRNSTYTFDGETLKESYQGEKYTWSYAQATQSLTTEYRDYDDVITVVLEKKQEETGPMPVDFEGILFGTDMSDSTTIAPRLSKRRRTGRRSCTSGTAPTATTA